MSIYLTKKDFSDGQGVTIKCPGVYELKDQISFKPKHNKTSAITIDSDNVILSLNGKNLKQSSKSSKNQIIGITVKTGHKNITILGSNGSIQNFTQAGIYIEGGNEYINLGDANSTLTITGCGYGTEIALFNGVTGVAQGGLLLGDMEFLAFFGVGKFYGLLNEVRVTNLVISENCNGVGLGEGSNYKFYNCDVSNNRDTRLIWSIFTTLNGFYLPNSVLNFGLLYLSNPALTPAPNAGITNIEFNDCRFNLNSADATVNPKAQAAYCDAFYMGVNYSGLKISKCKFNSNKTLINTETGLFSSTRGIVIGDSVSTVIENSEMCNNLGGNYVAGINVTGLIATNSGVQPDIFQSKGITIKNCVASGNIANVSLSADFTPFPPNTVNAISSIGFGLRYPKCLSLIDCTADNNYVVLPSGQTGTQITSSVANGVFIYSDRNFPCQFANNIEIRGCKFSKNRVTFDCTDLYNSQYLSANSAGIRVYDDLCENILIDSCFISNNLPGIDEMPYPITSCGNYSSSGVELFNTAGLEKTGPSYVTITNNKIQSNGSFGILNNLDFTLIQNNVIAYGLVGVLLTESFNDTILDNTFLLNSAAVLDGSSPSTSVVNRNQATTYGPPGSSYQVYYCSNNTCPVSVDSGTPQFPPSNSSINTEIANVPQPPVYPPNLCILNSRFSLDKNLDIKSEVKKQLELRKKFNVRN